jgi:uncharacterized phage infection (PIP) family protein YhgE
MSSLQYPDSEKDQAGIGVWIVDLFLAACFGVGVSVFLCIWIFLLVMLFGI